MKTIDNCTELLCPELKKAIHPGSTISIVADSFSIFAYHELQKQLERASSIRFIFTTPTFVEGDKHKSDNSGQFAISRYERSLCNSAFEIRPRNTLTQRELARKCVAWIEQRVKFKANITMQRMLQFILVDDTVFTGINGFTCTDLGSEQGECMYYDIRIAERSEAPRLFSLFEQLWNDNHRIIDVTPTVIERLTHIFRNNDPDFIYFISIYHIFNEFIKSLDGDFTASGSNNFQNSRIWNMLYEFQSQAAKIILYNLEKYHGTILADSVGLGKTFTALAVIKYYLDSRKSVLVLCPKKLYENWNMYRSHYHNNPLIDDCLSYDVLYHSDLSRTKGSSNGIDLAQFKWEDYDLLVIDESHNFRNGGQNINDDDDSEVEKQDNRYDRLMKEVIRKGRKTNVLMLSATPVNNRFADLKNQLALAYEGQSEQLNQKLNLRHSIDEIFKNSQREFTKWCKNPIDERTTDSLVNALDPDFFKLLEAVTIARSRKHVETYYSHEIGKFPQRLKPISLRAKLSNDNDDISYHAVYDLLDQLNLHVYTPSLYIHPSKLSKYEARFGHNKGITIQGRELGIRKLMATNLLKRIESCAHAFRLTLERVLYNINKKLEAIAEYETRKNGSIRGVENEQIEKDISEDDAEIITISVGKNFEIDCADMDYISWRDHLQADVEVITQLLAFISPITSQTDEKLRLLKDEIRAKIEHPFNAQNKKIIIFSAFADTADYLYEHLAPYVKSEFNLNSAKITGNGCVTTASPKIRELNEILSDFSPSSKARHLIPGEHADIDLLIATDVISEGQNLQDCDYLVNFDIHWNPVRIIQRFGRIDRIGSTNASIQLVNFWPDLELEDYIKLEERVRTRMTGIDIVTGNATENPLSPAEKGDLEYRCRQLQRLQKEVVDLEEMNQGVSIMDLGLNEFRLDLNGYLENLDAVRNMPMGLCAAVQPNADCPAGAIFVLRNTNNEVNIGQQNRIHPFYLVYVANDGSIIDNHLSPRRILSKLRKSCKGVRALKNADATLDDLSRVSELLTRAIESIVNVNNESSLQTFFHGRQIGFLDEHNGMDDFELVSFIVVAEEG